MMHSHQSGGHNPGSLYHFPTLQKRMRSLMRSLKGSSRGYIMADSPEQSPSFPASSYVLFLPRAPLPHSCRLQLLIVTNKEAGQHQMNPERSTQKQWLKSSQNEFSKSSLKSIILQPNITLLQKITPLDLTKPLICSI